MKLFCFLESRCYTDTHTQTQLDHTLLLVPCMCHVSLSHMNIMDFIKSIKNRNVTECWLRFLISAC